MNVESFETRDVKQLDQTDSFDIDKRVDPEQTSIESKQEEDMYDIDKRIDPEQTSVDGKQEGDTYDIDNRIKSTEQRVAEENAETDIEVQNTEQDTPRQDEYTDDNDVVYRIGDKLCPNTEFEINGYKYKTDNQGRVISAEGPIRVESPHPREWEDVRKIDNQEYKDTDDRGHLIAHWFGGSDKLENLIPMDAKLNRGDYNKLENTFAEAVKDDCKVSLKVEPLYESDSTRPSEIRVTYTIDGEKNVIVFKNEREVSL